MGATQRSLWVGFLSSWSGEKKQHPLSSVEASGKKATLVEEGSEDEFRKEEVAADRYVTLLHKILLSICRYYRVLQASV